MITENILGGMNMSGSGQATTLTGNDKKSVKINGDIQVKSSVDSNVVVHTEGDELTIAVYYV